MLKLFASVWLETQSLEALTFVSNFSFNERSFIWLKLKEQFGVENIIFALTEGSGALKEFTDLNGFNRSILLFFVLLKNSLLEENSSNSKSSNEEQYRKQQDQEQKSETSTSFRRSEALLFTNPVALLANSLASSPFAENVEQIYGDSHLETWTKAREYLSARRDEELSLELFTEVANSITNDSDPLRFTIEASMEAGNQLYTLDVSQVESLVKQGLFFLEAKDPTQKKSRLDSLTGVIIYPGFRKSQLAELVKQLEKKGFSINSSTVDLIMSEVNEDELPAYSVKKYVTASLISISEWYATQLAEEHDPYLLASELQRKIVQLHPLVDKNGMLSRLFLNWSLEKSGLDSAPFATDQEYFISLHSHARLVQKSVGLQKRIKIATELTVEDRSFRNLVPSCLGEDAFFTYLKNMHPNISLSLGNFAKTHSMTESLQNDLTFWLDQERKQYLRFESKRNYPIGGDYVFAIDEEYQEPFVDRAENPNTYYSLKTDSLFSEGLTALLLDESPPKAFEERELVRSFLSDKLTYRGVILPKYRMPTTSEVLNVFLSCVGVTASYQTLRESGASPQGFSPIINGHRLIGKQAKEFNDTLIAAKRDSLEDSSLKAKLTNEVLTHIDWARDESGKAGAGSSRYASVSFSRRTGTAYALGLLGDRRVNNDSEQYRWLTANGADASNYYGALITAQAPESGYIYVNSLDTEVLVPGGVPPEAVTKVEFFTQLDGAVTQLSKTPENADWIERNRIRYGDDDERDVTGDPLPLPTPALVFERHIFEENEYIVRTDNRGDAPLHEVYYLNNGGFYPASSSESERILKALGTITPDSE